LFKASADRLAKNFLQPPTKAWPWVYWFWNNANGASNAIIADLDAIQRLGIGGVLIMDVIGVHAPMQLRLRFWYSLCPQARGL
jgi:hypothetical protein